MTKSQLIRSIAESLNASKSSVEAVFQQLQEHCRRELASSGKFEVPGIARVKLVDKPATPATQKMNPFTRQMVDVPAKPATKRVKAAPVSELKRLYK